MNTPIHVLIADAHPLVREALHLVLTEEADIDVIGHAVDGDEVVRLAMCFEPDVVVMDLRMRTVDGVATTRQLRERGVPSRVLVLTSFADDERIGDALHAGAVGYVVKDVRRPDLLRVIRAAAASQPMLHPAVQRRTRAHNAAGIPPCFPRGNDACYRAAIGQALVSALPHQHRQLNLHLVQPPAIFRRGVTFELLGQPPRFRWRKGLVPGGGRMGIHVVEHHPNLPRLRKRLIDQCLHLLGKGVRDPLRPVRPMQQPARLPHSVYARDAPSGRQHARASR